MKNWLTRFMMGRYGADQLAQFLMVLCIVLLLVSLFVGPIAGPVLNLLALLIIVLSIYRMFSRNTAKRYRENAAYLRVRGRVVGWFAGRKQRFAQRKQYRFFKCKQCGTTLRVPRGKGELVVTCPKCKNRFDAKT